MYIPFHYLHVFQQLLQTIAESKGHLIPPFKLLSMNDRQLRHRHFYE